MKEIFKIIKKKKLFVLFVLKLIVYLSSVAVAFSYSKYITSPLTVNKLKDLIIALSILYLINMVTRFLCDKMNRLFIIDLKYDIELYYFNKLKNASFNNLNDTETGNIYHLIEKCSYSFYNIIDGVLECYLPLIIGIVSFVYMTLKQSVFLAVISLIIFTLSVVIRFFMQRKRFIIVKDLRKKQSEYNGTFVDFSSNVLTIKKLRIEDFAKDTLERKSSLFYKDLQLAEKKQGDINFVFSFLIDVVYLIILLTIFNDVKNGVDALPFLLFYISIVGKITASLKKLSRFIELSLRFKTDKMIVDEKLGNLFEKTEIGFENLKIINGEFSYKNNTTKILIPEFELNKKDKICITGESGQGKSTILNIISGYYELNKGSFLVDNKKIKDKKLKTVFISQETELFDLTIRENLCLGKNISEDIIERLFKEAGLYDWYKSLPKGLDEFVGEKGVKLSVGQKQRLNLIRGILIDSDIYLLDEPTSNLDKETEEKICKMIKKYFKDKTLIIVTHRRKLEKLANKHYKFVNHEMKLKS